MATLYNQVTINSPIGKIWETLSNIEELDKYDPTVKRSKAISGKKSGLGSKRKVDMRDGKNWFEEECTVWQPNRALTYELRACSFPIHHLKHSYSFEEKEGVTIVKQTMVYTVKFGLLGKLLDALMIRKQTNAGVKKFFEGLKSYTEK
jgi:ribosome-associated toxin RatA of RatAB toxin-antitoxin module